VLKIVPAVFILALSDWKWLGSVMNLRGQLTCNMVRTPKITDGVPTKERNAPNIYTSLKNHFNAFTVVIAMSFL
jgi:hypothetical protein